MHKVSKYLCDEMIVFCLFFNVKARSHTWDSLELSALKTFKISYNERTQWHAGAIYAGTLELHFSRAKFFLYFLGRMCVWREMTVYNTDKSFSSQEKKDEKK